MKVPFVDLKSLHSEIEDDLREVFNRVLNNSTFVLGPEVQKFEREFAAYVGTEHCVAVNTGTAALHLALAALGIGQGDEVITVPHTFIATAEAITAVGARPVFIDIDPVSYTMDPTLVEAAITNKTRAIIPVDLYGQVADMDSILEIATHHNIPVIEDACQAHGAEYKGRKAGAFGAAGCFSFYPGKNLGACGEAGAITTNDAHIAARCRMLRDHGQAKKYYHDIEGYNGRLDALQAGLLHVKLNHLAKWNEQRRAHAAAYNRLFEQAGAAVRVPFEPSWSKAVYHLYVVRVADREGLMNFLKTAEIGTGIHYPIPLHLQKAYANLKYAKGDFPRAEKAAAEILSLPMFPNLTQEQQARVVGQVQRFVGLKQDVAQLETV